MTIGRIPSVEGGIQPTIVDAKGDLIAATAADTVNRLAVGSNDQVLVADSAASTGLAWKSYGAQVVAGKNFLINGGFDIWQRGTSSGSAGYQTADRWYQNASNTTTFAQETTTIPGDSRFAFKMTAGATASMWIQQPIETLNAVRLAGKTIAVAADVSASTSTGMTINVYSSTTVDNTAAGSWGSAITPTSGGTGTAVSGSFTRISGTYAIPSTAKSVMVQVITTSTAASGVVVYVGNVQAEIGSTATPFSRAAGTLQGELAACQRYYTKSARTATAPGDGNNYDTDGIYATNATHSTTGMLTQFFAFPVSMRVAPTMTFFRTNLSATNGRWAYYNGAWVSATTTTGASISDKGFSVNMDGSYTINSVYPIAGAFAASAEL